MTVIEALNFALKLYHQGRLAEADEVCQAVLAAAPLQIEAIHLQGVLWCAQGRVAEAERAFSRIIVLHPSFAAAYTNLGVVRHRQGRLAEAVVLQSRALTVAPEMAEPRLNRGAVLMAAGDCAAAAADFARLAQLQPMSWVAVNNLGMALRSLGRVAAAAAAHRRAIVLQPDSVDAYRDLGHVLREADALPLAAIAYGRAFALDPNRTEAFSYQLFVKQAMCDWGDYDALCRQLGEIIDHDRGIVLPLANLAVEITAAQQEQAARRFYRSAIQANPEPMPVSSLPPTPCKRLTVAYFSADFHEHATAYLAAELFELHDRERFRPLAYSYGQDDQSPMRRRLIAAFERFHDIRNFDLDRVAAMVADDGVDILVDLKGYTKQSRLELLSRRLAPIEVAYLGYPGTVGCPFMDYVIGDRLVTPAGHQPYYTERLVIMPDSYQINDRHRPLGDVVPTRAACGLPDHGFVFCAFNTTYKITPRMFGLWLRLLRQVPDSVLWLFEANAVVTANLRREAVAAGIDPTRLVFAPKKPLAEHLARYRVADLCLDTFPYTGHTTTSDALWVGAPVVTCLGDTFASRVAAGLLTAAGLPETITRSFAEYEALALYLVANPEILADYRRRLETSRMTAPLFDSRRFTRHLEWAYEWMWQRHTAGLPPETVTVPRLAPETCSFLTS